MAPKFPTAHNLLLLLRCNQAPMVNTTLKGMYRGGISDHIGHGFSRYATDKKWLVHHFEKILYDNALLAYSYLEAYQVTGDELFATTAKQIFTYISNEMTDVNGGFYSAEDADSED